MAKVDYSNPNLVLTPYAHERDDLKLDEHKKFVSF